jgi:hypothetical protein
MMRSVARAKAVAVGRVPEVPWRLISHATFADLVEVFATTAAAVAADLEAADFAAVSATDSDC